MQPPSASIVGQPTPSVNDSAPADLAKKTAVKLRAAGIRRIFSLSYNPTHEKKAKRIFFCSTDLFYVQEQDTLAFHHTQHCNARGCPLCELYRARKKREEFKAALKRLPAEYRRSRYLFLTLTVKNCRVGELRETVKGMNSAWNRMIKTLIFQDVQGWARSLEVTRGEKDDSAHPHFHALLLVSGSYFKGAHYRTQDEWSAAWREAARLDYQPIVDIRSVKPNSKRNKKAQTQTNSQAHSSNSSSGLENSLDEIFKYIVKDGFDKDTIQQLAEEKDTRIKRDLTPYEAWFLDVTDTLHKQKMFGVGGIFKTLMKKPPKSLADISEEDEKEPPKQTQFYAYSWQHREKKYERNSAEDYLGSSDSGTDEGRGRHNWRAKMRTVNAEIEAAMSGYADTPSPRDCD